MMFAAAIAAAKAAAPGTPVVAAAANLAPGAQLGALRLVGGRARKFCATASVAGTMNLRRLSLVTLVALAIAATALAHGGHKHQFLGTVKALHESQLVVATTDEKEVTFTLTEKTRYTKGNAAATKADVKEGLRVSVSVENDGKTATSVKIAR